MRYCPHCGKAVEAVGSFCPHCGKALEKRRLPLKKLIPVGAVLAVIGALILILPSLGKDFSQDTKAIAKASASVVTVYTYDINGVPLASGSGFAALDEGIIVTNYHVIEGDTYRVELAAESGDIYTVDSVVCYDEEKDLALLRSPDCTLDTLPLGSSDLEKGEQVTSIGSPEGIRNAVSTGIFSTRTSDFQCDMLMTTSSISHGSSGGALFDESGKVVGVTSGAVIDGNDLYLAIPVEYVTELYKERTVADEQSLAVFWEQRDHSYTVDYVLANARKMAGQTITVYGYVSGMDSYVYLVPTSALVLGLDTRNAKLFDTKAEEPRQQMKAQADSGLSLQVELKSKDRFKDGLKAGAYCSVTGKVMVYDENNKGTDIRFLAEEISPVE